LDAKEETEPLMKLSHMNVVKFISVKDEATLKYADGT
jgi:hypothetical protein